MRDKSSLEEITMTDEDFSAALDEVLGRHDIIDKDFMLRRLLSVVCAAYSIVRMELFKETIETEFVKLMGKNKALPFTEGFMAAMARELKKLSLKEKEKGTVQ